MLIIRANRLEALFIVISIA